MPNNVDAARAIATPLRILLISHGYPPLSVGGVEQHVHGLARALLAHGHEVQVYSRTSQGGDDGTLLTAVEDGVRVTRVVYNYRDIQDLDGLYHSALLDAAFARFLRDAGDLDVAHAHHFTGLSMGVLHQLVDRGVPSAVTLHDYWTICPRGQMWHLDGSACAKVEPLRCAECLRPGFGGLLGNDPVATVARRHHAAIDSLSRADVLIVPSARALPPFVAAGLAEARVRVVENGVDTQHLEQVPPLQRRARGQALRIGYLGTLIPSKGLDVLVDAIATLPSGSVELSIHGNAVPYHGDQSFLTRVFSRLRPTDRVTYHGPYQTSDLARILTPLDCVVAPALWQEAFGLTVREALAAGRPALVSRIGGLQDAVRHDVDGFVFAPGDRQALAGLLGRLCVEPDLAARLGAAGRGRPRGFATMATELEALYLEARDRSTLARRTGPTA